MRFSSGYTAIELMMSIAVFTLSVVGIVSMQQVTISANQDSKSVAMASRIAESWLDELTAESAQWNEFGDFDDTDWLLNVGAEGVAVPTWFRPTYVAARSFGGAFDALGNPVAEADIAANAHFCTHVRLTWLEGQARTVSGNGLIRAEVRVFWRRTGAARGGLAALANICAIPPTAFAENQGFERYHVVTLSTTLRQHLGT